MDTNIVVVVAIFALILIAAFLLFRNVIGEIRLPLKIRLRLAASNPNQPRETSGISIEDAETRKGGISVDAASGQPISLKRVKSDKDISVVSKAEEGSSPNG